MLESELAIMGWLGVAKQAVQKWRRAIGVGRHNAGTIALRRSETGSPEVTAERNAITHPHLWRPEEDKLLGTMPDEVLARKIGRSLQGVQYRRQLLGIPANNNKRLGRPRNVSRSKKATDRRNLTLINSLPRAVRPNHPPEKSGAGLILAALKASE